MSLPSPDEGADRGLAPSLQPPQTPPDTDAAKPIGQFLDPFSFHGYTASVIGGVGGDTPNIDPAYAFHTDYVPLARGRVTFTVHVQGLRAKLGTLVLRVHMLDNEPGLPARMVTSERIQLNRLAAIGEISVSFEAFRGATYALMGLVAGQTDAHADALYVSVDRPYDEAQAHADGHADGRATQFGRDDVRGAALLLTLGTPTLAYPRSQPATANQLSEPTFRELDAALHISSRDKLDRWSHVYVARCLTSYGAIGAGARGLVLGPVDAGLASWLEAAGADVTFADTVFDDGCSVPEPRRRLTGMPEVARDLVDFDFVCSTGLGDRLGSAGAVMATIDGSVSCLRPLGFSVHVFGTGTRSPGLMRPQIERLALTLISRGHEISRMRSPMAHRRDSTTAGAFGIVVRRAKVTL